MNIPEPASIQKVIRLYKEYAIGQNAENVEFVKTVSRTETIYDMDGAVADRYTETMCVFRIFDTAARKTVYTLVEYIPLTDKDGYVTEYKYADTLDELTAGWEDEN